jgi:hypothetical protein
MCLTLSNKVVIKMKIRTMIFVGLLGISAQGNAGYFKAGEVLEICKSGSTADKNFCSMYLAAVFDVHESLIDWEALPVKYFCFPIPVTMGHLRKIFIRHANKNPQDLHFGAGSFALNAFGKAFPCE